MPATDVLHELVRLRSVLKDLLADIAVGRVRFSEVVALRDDDRTHLYVVKALEVVPGVGKVQARRVLDEMGIGEQARIVDLTDQQRLDLASRVTQ